MTEILDDVSEIEAAANQYLGHGWISVEDQADAAMEVIDSIPALCATVKHLRDGSKQLSHEVEVETRRGDNWERRAKQMGRDVEALENERDGLRGRATELHNRISERNDRIVELQSQLEQLRAENQKLKDDLEKESLIADDYAVEMDNFRTRAIQLCKDRAAEWQLNSNDYNDRDGMKHSLIAKAAAARELGKELEKL